jgi:ParB family chromosome partitioning protein
MNTLANTTAQLWFLAVSRLEKSPLNPPRTAVKVGLEELKASLLAHGLMQSLVVTDARNGTYLVVAGGRRLEALRSLEAEGKLPEDYAVPCLVVTDQHAQEMSQAENTARLVMHPADQFEAFAALMDKGESASQIAQRFDIDESLVLKRVTLARVAPELLAEYRKEGLTLQCLMAFTLTDDHRDQLKVFKSLPSRHKNDPAAIREALTERMVEAGNKLARFVGLDTYTAEGGATRSDLFTDEVYLDNPALLHQLAEQKLNGIRKDVEAEGWGWVESNPEWDLDAIHGCARIHPRLIGAPTDLVDLKSQLDAEMEEIEQALEDTESDALLDALEATWDQLNEVERKLAAHVVFDARVKALAGCYVSIAQDGTLFLRRGLVKPEHRKLLVQLYGTESSDGNPDEKVQHGFRPWGGLTAARKAG